MILADFETLSGHRVVRPGQLVTVKKRVFNLFVGSWIRCHQTR